MDEVTLFILKAIFLASQCVCAGTHEWREQRIDKQSVEPFDRSGQIGSTIQYGLWTINFKMHLWLCVDNSSIVWSSRGVLLLFLICLIKSRERIRGSIKRRSDSGNEQKKNRNKKIVFCHCFERVNARDDGEQIQPNIVCILRNKQNGKIYVCTSLYVQYKNIHIVYWTTECYIEENSHFFFFFFIYFQKRIQ